MADTKSNEYYDIQLKGSAIEKCLLKVNDNQFISTSHGSAEYLCISTMDDTSIAATNKKYVDDAISAWTVFDTPAGQLPTLKVNNKIVNYIDKALYKAGTLLWCNNQQEFIAIDTEPVGDDSNYLLTYKRANGRPYWRLEPQISIKSDGTTGNAITDLTPNGHDIVYSKATFITPAALTDHDNKLVLRESFVAVGDLLVGSGVGSYTRLSTAGANGKVLKVNNGLPGWADETPLTLAWNGSGNAITSITVEGHTIKPVKGETFAKQADLQTLSDSLGSQIEIEYLGGQLTITKLS